MATDTDVRIARAVALKASIDLVNGNSILLDQVSEYVEKYATLLLTNGVAAQPVAQPAKPTGDPGPTPPNEWPEDKEAYDAISDNDPPGPVGQTPPRCLCGGAMEYKSADDWSAYFCTEQEKSRDPRVQAEQKKLHPPVWL